MAQALYPGSFDPPTRGHLDLIRRAQNLFDGVTVAVAYNSGKNPIFTAEERVEMLRAELDDEVRVATFAGLVVDFCRKQGFRVIMRGLRNVSDFEYEYQMALTNRHIAEDIETVFVMPSAKYSFVASSLIKDVVRHGGDVGAFLTPNVEERLRQRLEEIES